MDGLWEPRRRLRGGRRVLFFVLRMKELAEKTE